MRIISIGDIHQHPEHCHKILDLNACDYLLVHGDLTNFGGRGAVSRVITALRAFRPQVLAQTGNLDRRSGDKFLSEEGINLHGRARLLQKNHEKLIVIGLGGANRTFFFTPNEFKEDEMARLLRVAWQEAGELMEGGANIPVLLLTHAPPYNTQVDRLKNGRHVGSKAVRAFIEERQPALCVCGHIHEGKGKDSINATKIINTGAFFQGGWADIRVAGGIASAKLF